MTINPFLTLDKGTRIDGSQLIKIQKWSYSDDDAPNTTKKLVLSNNSKADMTFNLGVDGPFEIVKTKSNTGAKHPLSTQGASKVIAKKIETMFCLQPLKIVELHVKFNAPKAGDTEEWPLTIANQRKGELQVSFSNGVNQTFTLEGALLRPKIVLLTEVMSRNDKA